MTWIKVLHLLFVISWMSAIFYLPRLFVYHANTNDQIGNERFKLMEKKLLGMMNFTGTLALVFGLWLWLGYGFQGDWLWAKLFLVLVLMGYHGWCSAVVTVFREDRNAHGHVFYRWMNELPVILLVGILILVVTKPF